MQICFDIEANSLLDDVTAIWCIVARVIGEDKSRVFGPSEIMDGISLLKSADELIGHNIIDYDIPALEKVYGVTFDRDNITDTLILSQLYRADIEGGHSLAQWGERFGISKEGIDMEFHIYTPKLLARCLSDVAITEKLYRFLRAKFTAPRVEMERAIALEHKIAWVCRDLHDTGFGFDADTARHIQADLQDHVNDLDKHLLRAFKPKRVLDREFKVRYKQDGTRYSNAEPRRIRPNDIIEYDETKDVYRRYKMVEFNPSSPRQIVDRLSGLGWKPVDRTDGYIKAAREKKLTNDMFKYGWKVNETNLATVPDDAPKAAHLLVERMMLASRVRTLQTWLDAYNPSTERIHGKFVGIGTWTHRMAHRAPNMGNVAAHKSIKYKSAHLNSYATQLGGTMRSLWNSSGYLTGCDADGIQLRVFAHYVGDPRLIDLVTDGDPHQFHADKLDISRDDAKTFIYAFLLGAGNAKIGEIVGGTDKTGAKLKKEFLNLYPGLSRLKNDVIPRDVDRKYFVGFDGRRIFCDSAHKMLAGYLQAGEAIIMKESVRIFLTNVEKCEIIQKMSDSWRFVNWVHDEVQIESHADKEYAEQLGVLFAEAIKTAGETLSVRCPLAGSYQVGRNWLETH